MVEPLPQFAGSVALPADAHPQVPQVAIYSLDKPRYGGDFSAYIHRMREITFYGWQVGMQQVAFSQLLRDEVSLGRQEAHACMLCVLDEQPVTLKVPDELAVRLLTQGKALGVRCRLEPPRTP